MEVCAGSMRENFAIANGKIELKLVLIIFSSFSAWSVLNNQFGGSLFVILFC